MTEVLITELAQIQALRVISRTSVMRFKGSQRPLPDIARELGVDAVVEGLVSRSSNLVRVSVRLIDPRSDTQLLAWAGERKVEDLLSLQSELAAAIADEIVELTEQERARLRRPRRVKPEVPEAYLRGRYHWNRRSEAGLNKGIECFLKVIEQDPDFALAHAGLADCYNSLGTVPLGHPPRQMRPRAKAAASRALEIDPELGEAHAALAYAQLYDWEWTEAERGFARAIEINPSYAETHAWYAHYLSARGRLRQALEHSRLASELDPLSLYVRTTAGFILYLAGRYEEASAQYRSALELDPGAVLPLLFEGFNALEQGRFEHAITSLEEADRATSRSDAIQGWLVQAYALGGQRARAAELLRALMQAAGERYVPPAALAVAHFGLEEIDRGFEWLGVAAEERSNVLVYLAVVPAFAAIRGDARYEALLTRMNLDTEGKSGSFT